MFCFGEKLEKSQHKLVQLTWHLKQNPCNKLNWSWCKQVFVSPHHFASGFISHLSFKWDEIVVSVHLFCWNFRYLSFLSGKKQCISSTYRQLLISKANVSACNAFFFFICFASFGRWIFILHGRKQFDHIAYIVSIVLKISSALELRATRKSKLIVQRLKFIGSKSIWIFVEFAWKFGSSRIAVSFQWECYFACVCLSGVCMSDRQWVHTFCTIMHGTHSAHHHRLQWYKVASSNDAHRVTMQIADRNYFSTKNPPEKCYYYQFRQLIILMDGAVCVCLVHCATNTECEPRSERLQIKVLMWFDGKAIPV